jgi:GDP-4-dehydro-6-deoxy-D-mannose reductase
MKYLVIGSHGFIGQNVAKALKEKGVELWEADYNPTEGGNKIKIDLGDLNSVEAAFKKVNPGIIINCAGTVENSEKALSINPIFTLNILQAIKKHLPNLKKVIFTGSAGEFGIVGEENLPVDENMPLMATNFYPQSKILETSTIYTFSQLYKVPAVVARLFNPIGTGMQARFLIPSLIGQIDKIQKGGASVIEVSRLDARRDYLDVQDIAQAMVALAESEKSNGFYNIGSGRMTSNEQLIDLILANFQLKKRPEIKETSVVPEPIFAIQADITMIKKEIGWEPKISLAETIKDIVSEKKAEFENKQPETV